MGVLKTYKTLEEKLKIFRNDEFFVIDTAKQFDIWYSKTLSRQYNQQKLIENNYFNENSSSPYSGYPYIFRGVRESSFKIFSSAQREWKLHEMEQWSKMSFLEYVDYIVQKAANQPLLKSVFKYYHLHHMQTDFPTLSILQHYGAPTPLIDFTYNLNVALYFATEGCGLSSGSENIGGYFSVYYIDRSEQERSEFANLLNFNSGSFPSLKSFYKHQRNLDAILYITDFENDTVSRRRTSFQDQRPLTILFNQRIIPQEGLFVFNPSPDYALEDCFNIRTSESNLRLKKMACVNIRKDLSEYIRRKIRKVDVDINFIYPQLDNYVRSVKEDVMNELAS